MLPRRIVENHTSHDPLGKRHCVYRTHRSNEEATSWLLNGSIIGGTALTQLTKHLIADE